MDETTTGVRKTVITIVAIVLIVLIITAAVATSPRKKAIAVTAASNQAANATPSTPAATGSTSDYKDGSYSATGSYESPGGTQQITVDVTLHNDIITNTSASPGAQDPTSESYESAFIDSYESLVIGKNINSVSALRMSGASLTLQGFDDAITQIENQARS